MYIYRNKSQIKISGYKQIHGHTDNVTTAWYAMGNVAVYFLSYMRWARCTMRFNSVGPLSTRRFWI